MAAADGVGLGESVAVGLGAAVAVGLGEAVTTGPVGSCAAVLADSVGAKGTGEAVAVGVAASVAVGDAVPDGEGLGESDAVGSATINREGMKPTPAKLCMIGNHRETRGYAATDKA